MSILEQELPRRQRNEILRLSVYITEPLLYFSLLQEYQIRVQFREGDDSAEKSRCAYAAVIWRRREPRVKKRQLKLGS